ncbi:hypothetical protein PSPO01_15618 [Paraphaeosphaeria sporulosa]
MRTPSPSKNQRQFPDDVYSPNDIGEATPRPDGFARSAYPIPNLSYIEAPANEPIEDGDDLQAGSPTRSHTQSQSSNPWNNRGGNGLALLEKLEEVGDGPVAPAKLKQRLAETDMGKMKGQWTDCCGSCGPYRTLFRCPTGVR